MSTSPSLLPCVEGKSSRTNIYHQLKSDWPMMMYFNFEVTSLEASAETRLRMRKFLDSEVFFVNIILSIVRTIM